MMRCGIPRRRRFRLDYRSRFYQSGVRDGAALHRPFDDRGATRMGVALDPMQLVFAQERMALRGQAASVA